MQLLVIRLGLGLRAFGFGLELFQPPASSPRLRAPAEGLGGCQVLTSADDTA